MFTGLIQKTGFIKSRSGLALEIEVNDVWSDLEFGESIAINGTCLTLEKQTGNLLTFHTLAETLKRTNLGILPPGSRVNMERALRLGSPLDGHIVTGHVDSTGKVANWQKRPGGDMELTVELPENIAALVAEKGSIAIDGVSLTVVAVRDKEFTVELIPITREHTALGCRKVGDPVNLEADLMARYAARYMEHQHRKVGNVTMQKLFEAGFVK
ncbi:MAG: riboflavin synthase [Lentisphaeria bacterium]|nr:riboflavin synthase [Lentisphaeria bacterium]